MVKATYTMTETRLSQSKVSEVPLDSFVNCGMMDVVYNYEWKPNGIFLPNMDQHGRIIDWTWWTCVLFFYLINFVTMQLHYCLLDSLLDLLHWGTTMIRDSSLETISMEVWGSRTCTSCGLCCYSVHRLCFILKLFAQIVCCVCCVPEDGGGTTLVAC